MPWFLFLLAAAVAVAATWRRRRKTGLALAAAGLPPAALFWPGRFFAEKMLTDLAMPLGLIWLGLLATTGVCLARRRRGPAAACLALAAALTAAGQGDVADALVRPLEERYRGIDPFAAGPFDAVCVLGGGLTTGPGRRVMASAAGDRVLLGARLYHAGVARRLVCTGKTPSLDPALPSTAEATERVWRQLGVPADAIDRLPGENTRAELTELKRLAAGRGWSRLGLVTSAWHMGRAERLAAAAGVSAAPLPADFQSRPDLDVDPWLRARLFSVIPRSDALDLTHRAIKERLARAVGR